MAASADGTISCHYKVSMLSSHTFTLDETEWSVQQISVCKQGCSSLSWCPYRSSDGGAILRVAVGGGDNCIHILK